jgi:hypothetical protein
MFESIFQIGDKDLSHAVFEAYGAIFEVGQLPDIRELAPDEKPSFNTYRYIDNSPDKKTVRLYTYDSNKKPYVMLVQARKIPDSLAKSFGGQDVITLNFNKDKADSFKATGTGGITAFNAAFGMMRQLTDELNAGGISYIPSGGDEDENAQKARLYNSYFSKFFPEYVQVPKEDLPPQQAAMGMDVRLRE